MDWMAWEVGATSHPERSRCPAPRQAPFRCGPPEPASRASRAGTPRAPLLLRRTRRFATWSLLVRRQRNVVVPQNLSHCLAFSLQRLLHTVAKSWIFFAHGSRDVISERHHRLA